MSSIPVLLSFLVAMMLTSLPLPERIGIFTGWFLGLTLDVMYGSLLGQNAMAFSIVAYLVNIMYLRVRMFPLWQQSVMVFLLVIVHLAINAWIRGISGQFSITWTYWMPALTSALVWPFLFVILRDIRRQIISK